MMKILLINAYFNLGGAAKATQRLFEGLKGIGVESKYFTAYKTINYLNNGVKDNNLLKYFIRIRLYIDKLALLLYPQRQKGIFSPNLVSFGDSRIIKNFRDSDIIHLHWVTGNFISINAIAKINKPIIWTLHDMWPFTGGCHYDAECGHYKFQCGYCPHLGSKKEEDLSQYLYNLKTKSWRDTNITVVTPSHWLAGCAKESRLFSDRQIEVIPNGIDINRFSPQNKIDAKKKLNLVKYKKIILFGAQGALEDKRKGFGFLREALQHLNQHNSNNGITLVILGASKRLKEECKFNFPTIFSPYINDENTLINFYSSADVFVSPSTQENFSNMVMESLACGTPVVAFNIGGMPDMIDHKQNGYLAEPYNVEDLANGIKWILEDEVRCKELSKKSRIKVQEEFSIELCAQRYINLYQKVLKNNA